MAKVKSKSAAKQSKSEAKRLDNVNSKTSDNLPAAVTYILYDASHDDVYLLRDNKPGSKKVSSLRDNKDKDRPLLLYVEDTKFANLTEVFAAEDIVRTLGHITSPLVCVGEL